MSRWWATGLAVLVFSISHPGSLQAAQEVATDGSGSSPSEAISVADQSAGGQPLVALGVELSPSRAAEIFLEANADYERSAYPRAAAGYQRLVEAGYDDGRVSYNLGNALLRGGELGRAIASYLRSRALRPRDAEVQANLAFARQSTRDAIEPPEPSAVLSTLFFWHFRLSQRELAIALAVVNLLFWSALVLGLAWPRRELIRWLAGLLLLVLLAVGTSLLVHRFAAREVAVIVPQELSAHTAPEEGSVVRFKLHAGTELPVEDWRQGWVRVSLPDGQQGWIE
jgi:hypothetical protein